MRNTAGVIDITPMHKYEIKGEDAKKFINKLITKDISNIQPNQVAYGIWCNEDGNGRLMMEQYFVLMKIILEFFVQSET